MGMEAALAFVLVGIVAFWAVVAWAGAAGDNYKMGVWVDKHTRPHPPEDKR